MHLTPYLLVTLFRIRVTFLITLFRREITPLRTEASFSLALTLEITPGRGMPPTAEVLVGVFPDSLLSGTLPSYGASTVARASDRGRVAEVMIVLLLFLQKQNLANAISEIGCDSLGCGVTNP
jgi:hypothetical protein